MPHDQPVFSEEIERLAAACHGLLPLPADYASPTGEPSSQEERVYQQERGAGEQHGAILDWACYR